MQMSREKMSSVNEHVLHYLGKEHEVFHDSQITKESVVLRAEPDVSPRLLQTCADVVPHDLGTAATSSIDTFETEKQCHTFLNVLTLHMSSGYS